MFVMLPPKNLLTDPMLPGVRASMERTFQIAKSCKFNDTFDGLKAVERTPDLDQKNFPAVMAQHIADKILGIHLLRPHHAKKATGLDVFFYGVEHIRGIDTHLPTAIHKELDELAEIARDGRLGKGPGPFNVHTECTPDALLVLAHSKGPSVKLQVYAMGNRGLSSHLVICRYIYFPL